MDAILQSLAQTGATAVLAYIILTLLKDQQNEVSKINAQLVEVVKANTKAMQELREAIQESLDCK